jgi:hypothetical protein
VPMIPSRPEQWDHEALTEVLVNRRPKMTPPPLDGSIA